MTVAAAAYTAPAPPLVTPMRRETTRCPHTTPYGGRCCLRGDTPHVYHACHNETCAACHREQYEAFVEPRYVVTPAWAEGRLDLFALVWRVRRDALRRRRERGGR